MKKEELINIVRNEIDVSKLGFIALTGSYVTDTQTQKSDVDILYECKDILYSIDIHKKLENILKKSVDMIPLHSVLLEKDEEIIEYVLENIIVIHQDDLVYNEEKEIKKKYDKFIKNRGS